MRETHPLPLVLSFVACMCNKQLYCPNNKKRKTETGEGHPLPLVISFVACMCSPIHTKRKKKGKRNGETHPLPLRVASALRLVCNLHFSVTLGIGNGQEHAVGHDDSQNQAVEPGVLHDQDCQLPDWAGASKDTEGEVSLLRLEQIKHNSW